MTLSRPAAVADTTSQRPPAVWLLAVPIVAIAAVAIAIAVYRAEQSPVAGSRSVPIHVRSSPVPANLASRQATITSDLNRTTSVLLTLRRPPSGQSASTFVADFDGSGGGEARAITCSLPRRIPWTVSPGQTQQVRLRCSGYVAPWQMRGLEYIVVE